jgi:hypothetical protein
MSPYLRSRLAVLGLLALLSLPAAARADDKDKVTVSVVTILASESIDKIDKKLKNIAAEIHEINPKLIGFQTAKETCKDVASNSKEKFELVEGQAISINVQRDADTDNKNLIRVSPPTLGDITYYSSCGKFLPIITEYKTKNGDVLIIAIRVQPCREK